MDDRLLLGASGIFKVRKVRNRVIGQRPTRFFVRVSPAFRHLCGTSFTKGSTIQQTCAGASPFSPEAKNKTSSCGLDHGQRSRSPPGRISTTLVSPQDFLFQRWSVVSLCSPLVSLRQEETLFLLTTSGKKKY